jgi:hypothetical protein
MALAGSRTADKKIKWVGSANITTGRFRVKARFSSVVSSIVAEANNKNFQLHASAM